MADQDNVVFIAGINYGPYDGGFTPLGVYSTEEKAWAALGKCDRTATNEVATVALDAPATNIDARRK